MSQNPDSPRHILHTSEQWLNEIADMREKFERVEEKVDRVENGLHELRRWQAFCYGVAAAIGLLIGVVLWVFDKWTSNQSP